MRTRVSSLLIVCLLASTVLPVWASQPAARTYTATLGVQQVSDNGWRDSRLWRTVRYGCGVWEATVFLTKGTACAVPYVGQAACGGCAVVAVIGGTAALWDLLNDKK